MEENEILCAPFSEVEIKYGIFSCYADGAPGPDGFPFLFYQKFWDLIKEDIVGMFLDFHKGELSLSRLNFAMLTLIPKVEDANNMKFFRPISLINCSFKIFSKAMNNRLIKLCDKLISSNQSAFIKGRYILESVVSAHEIIHEVHRKRDCGIIFKLDYEKAYDRVSWEFLDEMLTSRGFGEKWVGWIRNVVRGGSLCIRINDEDSVYFKTGKGLRQGDPLSPLLFNLVADVFTKVLMKAGEQA